MKLIKLIAVFVMLAGVRVWAVDGSISTSATEGSKGMGITREKNRERIPITMVEGHKAWVCKATDTQAPQVYFKIIEDEFKDGGHPSVVFTIDYFDKGTGPVILEYDALVEDKAGAAKRAGNITLSDTKTWKKVTFAVTDARFDDRSNGSDFRLRFSKDSEFILGGITIAVGTAPSSVVWQQTPRGKIIEGSFDQSKIFPGTTHTYFVYVPKQYDPAKPACVYVGQDGLKPQFPGFLNKLINEKQMPVTVGIFIRPGNLETPSKDQVIRTNRCYEYDSLGSEYARFLLEEVIPFVAKIHNLNLSQDGNDRAIGGNSSGGICAFNVAWERPDAFRRVYSSSGSYAAFRGGDILPLLVRESEPKPIRVVAYVGNKDMANSGGDWTLNNREMDRALKFSGYDYLFLEREGGHGVYNVDGFYDGMKWLWRDWPAPVKSGTGSPRIQDVLIPNEPWIQVGQGYRKVQGLAVNPKGEVYLCDEGANHIYKIGADGKAEPFLNDAQHVTALTVGSDGSLYGVSQTTGNVLAFDANGKARVFASGIRGHDLIALHTGGFYITEPGSEGAAESKVWFVSPNGEKKLVDTGLLGASGLATSSDGWLLNVADGRSHWVYSYQINADGTLVNKQRFHWLHKPDDADDSGADGLCIDREGRLFTATRMGIQITGIQGHSQGVLLPPSLDQPLSAICLGGPDFDILYATCGDKVFKRKVKVKGIHSFDEPVKPLPTKL